VQIYFAYRIEYAVHIHCAFDHDKLVPVICLMRTGIMVNVYSKYLPGAILPLAPFAAEDKED
jgi:hypothetical protein